MGRLQLAVVALACATCLSWAPAARAGFRDNFPPAVGWSRPDPFIPDDSSLHHGVLMGGPAFTWNSPLVADVDGDRGNGREVAIGSAAGLLQVFGADGTLRWEMRAAPDACDAGFLAMGFMPAVAPIFGDGVPYVVVGYGGLVAGCDGGVAAFEGATGRLAWRFSTREWERSQAYPRETVHGVVTTPAIADTDGDGRMEIAFGGLDRNFYLLEADGSVRWYYHAADTIFSSPVFVQLDDDPQLEVVTASDVSFGGDAGGGFIQAFDTTLRWPKRIEFNTGFLWRTPNLEQAPYSSPAVGDLLPDEPGEELVIGSGCYFPPSGGDRRGKWVKIFRLRDGAELQTLALPPGGTCMAASPALGDIDDDGRLEVVITNGDDTDAGGDGLGRVIAWDPEVSAPKWLAVPFDPLRPPGDPAGNDESAGRFASPVIGDVDGNGSLEVITGNFWAVHVLNGRDGTPLTCQSRDCGTQPTLFGWGMFVSTPAVRDLDGDGAPEVVAAGMHVNTPAGGGYEAGNRGVLYAWTGFTGELRSRAGQQPEYSTPWPCFHGDPDRRPTGTGGRVTDVCFGLPIPSVELLGCRLDGLRTAPACPSPPSIAKLLARVAAAAQQAATGPDRRARRALLRCGRLLRRAERLAVRRLLPDCAAETQPVLRSLADMTRSLADSFALP